MIHRGFSQMFMFAQNMCKVFYVFIVCVCVSFNAYCSNLFDSKPIKMLSQFSYLSFPQKEIKVRDYHSVITLSIIN